MCWCTTETSARPPQRTGNRGTTGGGPTFGNLILLATEANDFGVVDPNQRTDVFLYSSEIFTDDFESGDFSAWANAEP